MTAGDHPSATSREHAAILKAVHTLERALVAPAPGRDAAWKKRAAAALTVVVDELRQHCESAGDEGGLTAELESALGRPRELTLIQTEHRTLLESANRLLADLVEDEAATQCDEVRDRALALNSALRRHQAREADLILLAFSRDIGAGD